MKILLVEDDPDLVDVTAYAMRKEGFDLIVATDGAQALRRWQEEQPDLVLLDLSLPCLDGFEVCRTIRRSSSVPVIILTGRHDDENVVRGFQMGADDYVTKPFSPKQLAMRIRAVSRRAILLDSRRESTAEVRVLDMVLNQEAQEVRKDDRAIRLTRMEFRLLYLLASNPGRVVGSNRIIEYAWGYTGSDSSVLKTHISRIRRKLRSSPGQPGYIDAVTGVGYRFTV